MRIRTVVCLLVGAVAGIVPNAVGGAHAGTRVSSTKSNCGAVSFGNALPRDKGQLAPMFVEAGSPKDPVGCLVAAAARCRPATLRFDGPAGFDYSTSYALEVTGTSRSCDVTYTETAGAPWAPNSTNTTMQCASARRRGPGIELAGCTSTVQVPGSTNYVPMEG